VEQKASELGATAIVVITITYFSIVLGELVPKRIGQISPESIARLVARPLKWLRDGHAAFRAAAVGSTEIILKILGVKEREGPSVTEEEIHAMLVEGSDAGVIEHQEHAMLATCSSSTTARSARSWCRAPTSSTSTPPSRGKRT
jgi:putative hemolysin